MRWRHCIAAAAALVVVAAAPGARALDMAHVTCAGFFASGRGNMASIIMWLRGYHAGKTGTVAVTGTAEMRVYGSRLGHYCRDHPGDSVIDASERILNEEDHGI